MKPASILDVLVRSSCSHWARMEGVTLSEFVRDAVAVKADQVLNHSLAVELADVIGSVHGTGESVAERTSDAFGELLEAEHNQR